MGGILLPPPPGANKTAQSILTIDSKCSPPPTSPDSNSKAHSNSNFHQQLLDGLDSLSLSPTKDDQSKSGMPILTPANSFCAGDDFIAFDPIASASANVISANAGNGSKKIDDDLWSDFESFRSTECSANCATAKETLTPTAKFDDWAKF